MITISLAQSTKQLQRDEEHLRSLVSLLHYAQAAHLICLPGIFWSDEEGHGLFSELAILSAPGIAATLHAVVGGEGRGDLLEEGVGALFMIC